MKHMAILIMYGETAHPTCQVDQTEECGKKLAKYTWGCQQGHSRDGWILRAVTHCLDQLLVDSKHDGIIGKRSKGRGRA